MAPLTRLKTIMSSSEYYYIYSLPGNQLLHKTSFFAARSSRYSFQSLRLSLCESFKCYEFKAKTS